MVIAAVAATGAGSSGNLTAQTPVEKTVVKVSAERFSFTPSEIKDDDDDPDSTDNTNAPNAVIDVMDAMGPSRYLPVLTYRALRHHVQAARFWENGDGDPSFRWNNYFGRYHWRHVDLMDVLSGFQGRGRVGLNNMAMLLGLPGKLGMTGAAVADAFLEGRIVEIRNYCETDVINTYLIYLRFELLRGRLNADEHARECALVRSWLASAGSGHLSEFLDAWPEPSAA